MRSSGFWLHDFRFHRAMSPEKDAVFSHSRQQGIFPLPQLPIRSNLPSAVGKARWNMLAKSHVDAWMNDMIESPTCMFSGCEFMARFAASNRLTLAEIVS